jgi:tRNA threonylcarbamoyladenosine biosynthesis protein TsaB
VAIAEGKKVISSREEILERAHAEKLPSFCREVLNESGFSVHNLDGVAVSIGPGSFTGLRIGLSFAKGIAFSGDLAMVPVPTLLSMVADSSCDGKTADVCLRSHKEIVYYQQFFRKGESWVAENEPICDKWEVVTRRIGKKSTIIHFGCEDLLNQLEQTAPIIDQAPSALSVASVGFRWFKEFSVSDYQQLEPDYISSFKTGG